MSVSPGALIRDARHRARLTQTELAQRAGVAQSVISAYETDRREPGVRMLTKLIAATGHHLVIEAVESPGPRPGLPPTRLGRRLRRHRQSVIETAARYGARNVRVFGSVARGEDTSDSDVDLLVDLDANVGLVALAGLTRELIDLLHVPVDVVPAESLKVGARHDAFAQAIAL